MKKHLTILLALILSSCGSSSSKDVISSFDSSKEVEASSSSVISSSSEVISSSINSSSSAISSSVISSSSTISSSVQEEEQPLSSLEAFNTLHEGLKLKNCTLVAEEYIEEKLIGEKMLINHYLGKFSDFLEDDGCFAYLDQGIYRYVKDSSGIKITKCDSVNPNTKITELYYTTYDLLSFRSKWKTTTQDYIFTSTNKDLCKIIAELDGQGIFAGVAETCTNTLEVADDGLSATYTTAFTTDGYGDYEMTITIKDIGTTHDEVIETYLANAAPLEAPNDFPQETKDLFKEVLGFDLPVPSGASYAYEASSNTKNGEIVEITYDDFLIGDQVVNYRKALEDAGLTLSDITDELDDLKKLGYVRYYYEIVVDDRMVYIETYFKPKVNLGTYEQSLFPNGIFHIRLVRP